MNTEKKHLYFVPGLAANPSIFDFINLPEDQYELHFLEWLIPVKQTESIEDYAKRMCQNINHDDFILIGVSFGGVMVQEMKKICQPKKTILISSIKSKNEMPVSMRFSQKTKAHKLIPTKAFSKIEKYEKFAFGNMLKGKVKLYKKYLSMNDELYIPWAIDTIVNWRQDTPCKDIIHIHGTKDYVFPIENINNCIKITGGTHAMILNRAKEISNILLEHL
jgi:hypothetical protein